jgi:hypothetical protein
MLIATIFIYLFPSSVEVRPTVQSRPVASPFGDNTNDNCTALVNQSRSGKWSLLVLMVFIRGRSYMGGATLGIPSRFIV